MFNNIFPRCQFKYGARLIKIQLLTRAMVNRAFLTNTATVAYFNTPVRHYRNQPEASYKYLHFRLFHQKKSLCLSTEFSLPVFHHEFLLKFCKLQRELTIKTGSANSVGRQSDFFQWNDLKILSPNSNSKHFWVSD